jgi:uncharacterized protein YndB with AHSA1/START domain
MGGLKGRVNRARQDAQAEGVVIELRDGSSRVFDDMHVWAEMFLTRMDLFGGKSKPSEVLDAVRQATPESRRRFEEEYGTITPEVHIVAADYQGGWVEVFNLEEDGTVTKARHEGGSEQAERIRTEARQSGPTF